MKIKEIHILKESVDEATQNLDAGIDKWAEHLWMDLREQCRESIEEQFSQFGSVDKMRDSLYAIKQKYDGMVQATIAGVMIGVLDDMEDGGELKELITVTPEKKIADKKKAIQLIKGISAAITNKDKKQIDQLAQQIEDFVDDLEDTYYELDDGEDSNFYENLIAQLKKMI